MKDIIIKGAREHNLKNINVTWPRDKLIVITGLSGSGKSTLAFDTIYAEGQRRYVESLSAYARQFLGLMNKPDVDSIDGLSPAISIEQKYGGHAKQTALAALGHDGYNRKLVIVVDEDIDPSSLSEVAFAIGLRSSPDSWDIVRDCWCGSLHPLLSPQKRELGDKTHSAVMILACKPYYWIKDFPPRVGLTPELEDKVRAKWQDLVSPR